LISFLGSEVGRGHGFYLDGLVRAIEAAGRGDLVVRRSHAFEVSRGIPLLAWRGVRAMYLLAGRARPLAALYHGLRGTPDYDRSSLALRILGQGLRRWARPPGIVVVDHPLLVGALGGREDVWYMHGEITAPAEACVARAARVFVPLPGTAAAFARRGVLRERLVVTGLCVESELVPEAARTIEARRKRIAGHGPLSLGFLSSGAEPVAHVAALAAGAVAVAAAGHRAFVVAARGGRLERAVLRRVRALGRRPEGLHVLPFTGRAELDRVSVGLFADLDAIVSPPHERSNWALGLGLPFLLVGPDIGPYAPQNREVLLVAGVAAEIESTAAAAELPLRLAALREEGELLRMSERGSGLPLGGFARAAAALIEEADRRARGGTNAPREDG
jgi:hypothetical protein